MRSLPWEAIRSEIDRCGFTVTASPVLTAKDCERLREGFDDDGLFRSTVDMARHRFGEGVYRYYAYPLPPAIAELRVTAYRELAPLANAWATALGAPPFPAEHEAFVDVCHQHGQARPTPLILRYTAGGWNAMHQDLYGEVAFPLQLTVALTRPGVDFEGGENLFVEQRPRAQSRGSAVTVPLGHAVIFATHHRPVAGGRGTYRVTLRHGVSTVRRGERVTAGVIFHDAA